MIWIVVIGQSVQNLHSVTAYIGYAGGFAAGNFVGMWLENKLAFGTYNLRVMISGSDEILSQKIHEAGFVVTKVDRQGYLGAVKLIYTVIKRSYVKLVMNTIHENTPNSFVTVEEERTIEKGIFLDNLTEPSIGFFGRKSK